MAEKVKKQEEEVHLYESPEALQEQISTFQEKAEKNKTPILAFLTVVVLIIGGYFFFQLYKENRDKEAQKELFQAVFYFEKDSLTQALQGDGNLTIGFKAISEDYGMTEAGNLANFYAGMSYLKQGEYDNAITALTAFSSSDYLVQARAYALIGDAYAEKEDLAQAASFYKKAASYKENEQFSPMYLLKLASVYASQGNSSEAKSVYQKIINEYPKATNEVNEAKKLLANTK